MLSMVILPITIRALLPRGLLLFNTCVAWIVHALVNLDVHFFDKNAVSWYSISLLDINKITYYKFSYWDGVACSMGSTVHYDSLIVDFIFKFQELELFNVVTDSGHNSCEDQTTIDSQRLDIASMPWVEDCDTKVNCGCPNKEDHVVVFKLSGQQSQEAFDGRQSDRVLSE